MTETHPEKRLIGYARVSTYGRAWTLSSPSFAPLNAAAATLRAVELLCSIYESGGRQWPPMAAQFADKLSPPGLARRRAEPGWR